MGSAFPRSGKESVMTPLDIIKYQGEYVVTSEVIANGSGVQHKNVLELIDANLSDFEEFGQFGVAFETRPFETAGGTQYRRVALLNEQQATLLMTFQRNTDQVRAFKKALVKAFFEMAHQMQPTLTEEQIVHQALAITSRKVKELEAKVAEDAPKVLFADSVSTSSTAILVRELAVILRGNGVRTGEKRLYETLREDGFLIRREGTDYNMPTQKSMELGLFRVKETAITHSDGRVTISKTPKITGKGQAYFVQRYGVAA